MRYELRPIGQWNGPHTRDRQPAGRFRARWPTTLELLGREAEMLGARLVVIQIDVTDGELRRDGTLRSNARVGFPGVRVAFDSIHGPLSYATDTYESRSPGDPPSWQANVRAVALALEALRAVDRYGVTRAGEQYRGWTAIEGGQRIRMSVDVASRLLAEEGGSTPSQVVADPAERARAFKRAAGRHHPERGGDAEFFRRLCDARDVLDGAADLTGSRRP